MSILANFCECGCGRPAPISKVNHARRGWVKGQPLRFILFHWRKQATKSYRSAQTTNGRLRVHVIRAEHALGKPLPPNAVVHHADGSRRDDAPLVICENQGYHGLLHARMKIQRHGGNPNTEAWCSRCRTIKAREAFGVDRANLSIGLYRWCRDCNNSVQRERWAIKKQVLALEASCPL